MTYYRPVAAAADATAAINAYLINNCVTVVLTAVVGLSLLTLVTIDIAAAAAVADGNFLLLLLM